MKEFLNKIRHNHLVMMLICCLVPLAVLVVAINFFGVSRSYLTWAIFLLCPLLHFIMMRDIHKSESKDGKSEDKKSCH